MASRRTAPECRMAKIRHRGPISSVAAAGQRWASAGYDNQVILWEEGPQGPQALAAGMHDHLVNHVEFSPDGRSLVSASSDFSARLWSVPELRLQALLTGHEDDVDMASFSPDGTRIATCALDRSLRVFDRQGHCQAELRGHTGNIISVIWRPDGSGLVSCGVDGTVREWDLGRSTQAACHALDARTDTVVAGPGDWLVAGDDLGRITCLHGDRRFETPAHQAGIKKLVCAPGSGLLASASYDGTLAIWKLEDGLRELARTRLPPIVWPRAACFRPDGQLLLGTFGSQPVSYDWRADSWNLDRIEPDASINAMAVHAGHRYTVGDAGRVLRDGQAWNDIGSLCNFLAAAGDRILCGGQLGQLFDADDGQVLHQHRSPLNCAVGFLRDGRQHLAVGCYTGELLVFEFAPQPKLVAELPVFGNAVKGIASDGRQLFAVCANTAVAWIAIDTLTRTHLRSDAHDKIANACCPAAGQRMASISRDRSLRLWNGTDCERYPSPHPYSVKSLAANPDGTVLMTGSYGGTVAAFDVPTRRWISCHRVGPAGISCITYDPKLACFLAADYLGEIHAIA